MSFDQVDLETKLTENASHGTSKVAFGILANAILAAAKILSGIVGNSYALIADGIESMLDIVSSSVVWGSLKIAAQPPDREFPYGYGKVEPLAAMVVGMALCVAALGIAIQSVREILTPHHAPAPFTLAVLVGVVLVKELMFRRLNRAGYTIGSSAIQADAWHHRSDAMTSLAAFVGISVALIAGEGYESADDWAALFACCVILYNAIRLFRPALKEMLDAAPSSEVESQIRSISSGVEGVCAIEKCRIRKSGLVLFVDIHVVVDGEISVNRGHQIAHDVKDALLRTDLGVLDTVVHIEPRSSKQLARESMGEDFLSDPG